MFYTKYILEWPIRTFRGVLSHFCATSCYFCSIDAGTMEAALNGIRAWLIMNPSTGDYEKTPHLCWCCHFGVPLEVWNKSLIEYRMPGMRGPGRSHSLDKFNDLGFVKQGKQDPPRDE
jgi:hypothetical protein